MYNTGATLQHFNPLPPCGGRLLGHALHTGIEKFQSTPSVWRETKCKVRIQAEKLISIHSLRVEGDETGATKCKGGYIISIHSLRVEGD